MSDEQEMAELRRIQPLVQKIVSLVGDHVRENGSTTEAIATGLTAIGMAHGAIIAAAAGDDEANAMRGCRVAVSHLPSNVLRAMEAINVGEGIRTQESQH